MAILRQAYLVLTDSGGIQEEAPAFGKPVLVLRSKTERPEGIAAGVAELVGTNREHIFLKAHSLLTDKNKYLAMAKTTCPYGDGHAAERIIQIIKNQFIDAKL